MKKVYQEKCHHIPQKVRMCNAMQKLNGKGRSQAEVVLFALSELKI
jgi:hypothetical protein